MNASGPHQWGTPMEYRQCDLVSTEGSGAADENIDDSDIFMNGNCATRLYFCLQIHF